MAMFQQLLAKCFQHGHRAQDNGGEQNNRPESKPTVTWEQAAYMSKTSSPVRTLSHSILSLTESILIRRIRITHQKAMLTRASITSAKNATPTIQRLLKAYEGQHYSGNRGQL
jgi:hypothetical protein